MPQATLEVKSNEALVSSSESHPETDFRVLGAWSTDGKLRAFVETSTIALPSLEETLSAIPALAEVEIRHATEETILFEVSTPTPAPHGAMAESGVVPSFPLRLEGGWFVGDLTASRERLSTFRDELEAAGMEHQLIRIPGMDDETDVLTARRQEVVELAVEQGYYELPAGVR